MAHLCRLERSIVGMAGITLSSSRNMGCRLAQGICAVMTCGTAPGNGWTGGSMIKCAGRPGCRRAMASGAFRRSRDVGCRLYLCILRDIGATMASRT